MEKAPAVVFFGDGLNPRSNAYRGTNWGVKGVTMNASKAVRGFSINMIYAVSPLGGLCFILSDKQANAATLIDYLRPLLVNAERSIVH